MLPCFPTQEQTFQSHKHGQKTIRLYTYIAIRNEEEISEFGEIGHASLWHALLYKALKNIVYHFTFIKIIVFFSSWSTKTRYCGWNFTRGKTEDPDRVFELYRGEQRFWVCGRFVFIIFIWFSNIKIYTRVRLFISERYWIGELKTF